MVVGMSEGRRDQHAVILQHPVYFCQRFFRFRYDMQGVGYDDDIEGLSSIGQAEHILHRKMELRRLNSLFCLPDHFF